MTKQFKRAERLLTIDNVNLQYGKKVILRDINLHIDNIVRENLQQGQCVALLGPSGIGKTQLFRCIAGLQRPTEGAVRIKDETTPVATGVVGVVQQSYPLLAHRTIQGNLELVTNDKQRINELLNHFDLQQHSSKYPIQLSGGQRQRIAIIQQMLASKHFLLMDEPFSGLDVVAKDRVCGLIKEVNTIDEHNTTIFTTHDLESAVAIADTIWIMGREPGKEGATIVKTIDLIARGIAWEKDVEAHPQFWPTVKELKEIFKNL